MKAGNIAATDLKQVVEKIERLESEKAEIAEYIKQAYLEARAKGFDPKILRKIISLRKMEASERHSQEYELDLYKQALGMIAEEEEIANYTEGYTGGGSNEGEI